MVDSTSVGGERGWWGVRAADQEGKLAAIFPIVAVRCRGAPAAPTSGAGGACARSPLADASRGRGVQAPGGALPPQQRAPGRRWAVERSGSRLGWSGPGLPRPALTVANGCSPTQGVRGRYWPGRPRGALSFSGHHPFTPLQRPSTLRRVNKTSVYLDDEDIARLRRLQDVTGKSQSELLREGIRALTGEEERPRRLGSLGAGSWPVDEGGRRWDADELARRRGVS